MNTPTLPQLPLIKSVTDLRYKAREIMQNVTKDGKTVLLTHDNDPVAVLFPIQLYETIRQYIEDTKDLHDLKKELIKKEKPVDFTSLDTAMRKKHKLEAYVPHRSSK